MPRGVELSSTRSRASPTSRRWRGTSGWWADLIRSPRRAHRLPTDPVELYREIAGESILLAGGGRALLLQLAHPSVARGVAEHSRFADDPTRRLVGTVDYLYTLAFGTEEQIAQVARRVGNAHRVVRSGSESHAYDARDSDLQLWVAATLYESTIVMYELAWGVLPDPAAEIVYHRSARIGTALGMPADLWPATREAFAAYWNEQIGSLEVTPTARRVARELLRPAHPQPWIRPLLPLARVITAGLLPPRMREGYGIEWTAVRERLHRRRLEGLLCIYRRLPRTVRTAPAALSRRAPSGRRGVPRRSP